MPTSTQKLQSLRPDLERFLLAKLPGPVRSLPGGERLARSFIAKQLDELCATVVPRVVAGDGPRIVTGPPADVPLILMNLLEGDGTLLARWRISPEGTSAGVGGQD